MGSKLDKEYEQIINKLPEYNNQKSVNKNNNIENKIINKIL